MLRSYCGREIPTNEWPPDIQHRRNKSPTAASSGLGMLLVILATTMATLFGFALMRKGRFRYFLDWAKIQIKYNAIAVEGIFFDNVQHRSNKTELPQLTGKIAIVTGGSRGLGLEVIKMLLQCDIEVIIACRNTSAGEKAIKTIRESGIQSGTAKVMQLDNSSLDSVRSFVEEFKKNYDKLDILINNAGVMFTPYRETKDGYEEQYGVNYLSHFLLSLSLLPLLENAGSTENYSRIVNVSSCAHLLGDINFDDINCKENFLTGVAYAQSKLAQLLFTKSLARHFGEKKLPISVNAVHPGIVNTDLFDNSYIKYLKFVSKAFFKNPIQGATPIVFTAVNPQIEGKSGLYISNCRESSVKPLANDEALQDRLFNFSLKQVGLEKFTT